jgi:ATP-dependent DNA helicase RecQ
MGLAAQGVCPGHAGQIPGRPDKEIQTVRRKEKRGRTGILTLKSDEVMMMLKQTLTDTFGFDTFKPGQQAVIDKIAAGESAAAIFPTGAGKSLCYQLPALHEPGMTLVISPLLSLMKDQIDFLKMKNVAAAKLDSGMSPEEYRDTLEAARRGKLKILMIAVERFKNERFRTQLRQMNVSLLVVDEAHCISEWGHNFRPDYLKIPTYQKEFGIGKVLLLTATATAKVMDDMCEKFAISRKNLVQTGFYRQNLFLRLRPSPAKEKDAVLREVLSGKPAGSAIVYVTFQKTAENTAAMLTEHGFQAEPYHAGMKSEDRDAIQNRFMTGKIGIVVATIAFGMGIDKENIRKVIHYDLPKSMESYSQEIGRAGRDEAPSLCCMLADRSDVPALENFAYGDRPDAVGIKVVLEDIKASASRNYELRAFSLSRESDIRMLPLKTLLVYLEMENILSPRYTYFEQYPFQIRTPAQEIINNFEGERKTFVQTIFNHSENKKTWSYPDIEAIMAESRANRQRVLTAMEYFHENGWIEMQPKSAVEVFEILNHEFDMDATVERLAALFKRKEAKDVARIHAMIDNFEKNRCLAQSLSDYFGETLETPCGRCTTCLDKKPPVLPALELPSIEGYDCGELIEPLNKAAPSPPPVHMITRFLCGISSPHLVRCKAARLRGFGQLKQYPYKDVEKWVKRWLDGSRAG